MPTSLGELSLDNGDVMFFGDNFRSIIEQNLEYIKNATTNVNGLINYGELSDAEAVACEGDFRKVAAYLKIPHHLVWIVMRVNGLLNHEEYTREKKQIIIPDYDLIYKLQLSTAITQTNI